MRKITFQLLVPSYLAVYNCFELDFFLLFHQILSCIYLLNVITVFYIYQRYEVSESPNNLIFKNTDIYTQQGILKIGTETSSDSIIINKYIKFLFIIIGKWNYYSNKYYYPELNKPLIERI